MRWIANTFLLIRKIKMQIFFAKKLIYSILKTKFL